MAKKIVKTGNFSGYGSKIIEEIIKEQGIDMNLYYVHSFKVKKGSWDVAAKKREQELTWTNQTQKSTITNKAGKVISEKETDNIQIMEGYSNRYPEFMVHESKNNSIEVTFMRKPIEADILESYREIVKKIPIFEVIRKPGHVKRNGIAGEIATYDAHLGKLAWLQETGYRNYDLGIAAKDYNYATEENLDYLAPHKPEKIFYIVGQDMYHMDNMSGQTTSGNHNLDVDGRITKVHNKAFAITRDNIIRCSKLAPVEVIWIPGNHDFLASYMLCHSLKQYFRNYNRVTIDIEEKSKKARLWGDLLVGWTHRIVGKHNTWSNELAQAWPELWGQSKFREWHHGDQHKKQDVKAIPVFTSGGVVCRQITALSPVDKWHDDNVYTDAVPGGEAYLWSKDKGVFANFMTWTGQYEEKRNQLIKKSN